MKWSWTIGHIAGIKLRMHWTFLLLLGWVAVSYAALGDGWRAAVVGVGFILAIFGCVVLHECGHALVARRYGVPTLDITLLPIGGLARMQRIPSHPVQEFWIAIAGPAVNVVIAAILFGGLMSAGISAAATEPVLTNSAAAFFVNLMWVNVILVVFNLLPAFPMDGGRILRAILAMRMNYLQATNIAVGVGQAMAILFGVAGLFINPFLLFIALFVYLGAEAEGRAVQLRSLLGDTPVRDAMMTRIRTLAPADSLKTAVDELLAGSQQDFPVLEESTFRGMLRRNDLISALQSGNGDLRVADVEIEMGETVREDDRLQDVLERMREIGMQSLPVFRDHDLVGMVTMENVGELVMVRGADEQRQQAQDEELVDAA